MPKLKTHQGANKRFRKTKSGKFLRSKSFARHLMTGKNSKKRRSLRKSTTGDSVDNARVRTLLPYA